MEFVFPQMVWLHFYRSKFLKQNHSDMLARNTKTARKLIKSACDEGCSYMEVYLMNDTKIYTGKLDVDAVIKELREYFEDDMFPMFKAEAYVKTDEFVNETVRFLEMAKESLPHTTKYEKEKAEEEKEKIEKCIQAVRSIKAI